MSSIATKVIRSKDVNLAGPRRVGCGSAQRPGTAADGAHAVGAAGAPAGQHVSSARIVAEDAAGATIEIVCSCGKRSYVRCAYRGQAPAQMPADASAERQTQENEQ